MSISQRCPQWLPVDPSTGVLLVEGSFSASFTPPVSSAATAPAQTTVGAASIQVLAANLLRKGCGVQNTGTTVVKLGLGAAPTQTAYHVALPASGSANDGSSARWDGTFSGVLWQGAVYAISSAAGGTAVVTELT